MEENRGTESVPAARKDFRQKSRERLENVMVLQLPLAPSLPACSCEEPIQRTIPSWDHLLKPWSWLDETVASAVPLEEGCAGCASRCKKLGHSSVQWQGKLFQVQIDQGHWDWVDRELTELLHGELEVKGLPTVLDSDVLYLFRSRAAKEVEPYDLKTRKEAVKIILHRFPSDLSSCSGRQ